MIAHLFRGLRRFRRLRPRSDRSGQAAVEFALIAPILLLLVFGLIDFARAWSAHHVIADAAREGARMVVVNDAAVGVAEAEEAVRLRLSTAGLKSGTDATRIWFTPADGETDRGEPLTIDIEYDFDFWVLAPLMEWVSGEEQVQLASRIIMRTE